MLKEFKEFALRGNVVDMAVGIVIGAAFGTIVTSFVTDLITPLLGLVTGGTDFSNLFFVLRDGSPAGPYPSLPRAAEAGAVTLNLGVFLNAVLSFLIVAVALFAVVKAMNALRREAPAAEPPPPPAEEILLREIRDLLKSR
ncbi:MAG: large conductance mechanosensitive channel protein MscL [bacterium]|nr:large conductance mechanosensitive channel protein MscL [bacterium]